MPRLTKREQEALMAWEQKKERQREAGRKSWITRRANSVKNPRPPEPSPPTADFQLAFRRASEALAAGKKNAEVLVERYVTARCAATGQEPNRVRAAVRAAASRMSLSR